MTDDLHNRLQTALGDGYLIERELGGAGMSRVFAATEQALQRRVVVKVLPPDLAAGVNHERFRREIQVAAQLQHPHVVPLLAAGENGGLLWFTMPFIEGESLRAAIARRGRFPARDVIRILHDVTDALSYAHARGVVHRDIKPGNILTSGMHALVTDFGVAKALTAATPAMNVGTTTGMAIGTPAYMAPEQLAADPAADHRMDIYAVGLLGYELLTGKSPFNGTSPQATLAAQLTLMPEAPSRSLPEVPQALSDIIMKCLEKDANKRFPSATALLAELDALPMIGSGETPSLAIKRSNRGPMIATAAVVLVAAGFLLAQRGTFDALTGKRAAQQENSSNAANSKPGNGRAGAGGGDVAMAATGDSGAAGALGAHRDTVYLYRDTNITDAEKRTTLPLVLTRADSIAIVESFRQRKAAEAPAASANPAPAAAAGKAATGVTAGTATLGADGKVVVVATPELSLTQLTRDSLFAEVARMYSDSIKIAVKQLQAEIARVPGTTLRMSRDAFDVPTTFSTPIIAPPTPGTTRVVVQPFTVAGQLGNLPGMTSDADQRGNMGRGGRPSSRIGHWFADSVRAQLTSHTGVSVVDADFTAKAEAMTNPRSFIGVGFALRADYIVSGSIIVRRDSVTVTTQFNGVRGGFTRTLTTTLPAADLFHVLPTTSASVNAWIDSARVSRRVDRNTNGRGANGRMDEFGGESRGQNGRGPGGMVNFEARPPKTPPPPADMDSSRD
ncbi:MAG: serine/threonine-protein kinase [Gemmatimonas sp.]